MVVRSLDIVGTHEQRTEGLVDHSTVDSACQSFAAHHSGYRRVAYLHHGMAVEVPDVVGLQALGNCYHIDVWHEDRGKKCRFSRDSLADLIEVEGGFDPGSSIGRHMLASCSLVH